MCRPTQSPVEFTIKAIVIGALFGLLFGASTVYLGLRAGLTVSASIPIAVLAISVLKKLGGSTILENNIVQTIGSAGESVAGGVVFTIPALIFLTPYGPAYFSYFQIAMLAFAGGILGVLMMVPLRRALIVKEHGVLPYPEGTACADVLIAGERGGKLAAMVFGGLGIGALWKALSWVFNIFLTELDYSTPRAQPVPERDAQCRYLARVHGRRLRHRSAHCRDDVRGRRVVVAGVPAAADHSGRIHHRALPADSPELREQPRDRHAVPDLGDGARAAVERVHPLHRRGRRARGRPDHAGPHAAHHRRVGARRAQGFRRRRRRPAKVRTERDIPTIVVLGGSLALAVFLFVMPRMPTQGNILASVLVIVFGFLFVTVSSRITGLIGTSSNPISGMTIATLILTCLLFVALGWTGDMYSPVALCVGAIVCIAAANAGGTAQDLKTGYLVGATPIYQQIGLVIGVITSALVIGWTTLYLHSVFGIGSKDIPAPQATLMATIIKGLLSQNLPWGLVLVGVFISVALELCGVRSLSFAVGSYLPIATTAPIFAGGMVRAFVERKTGAAAESEVGAGTLFSSGLIAGGSLCGILFAVLVGTGYIGLPQSIGNAVPFLHNGLSGDLAGVLLFLALAVILARAAQKKVM